MADLQILIEIAFLLLLAVGVPANPVPLFAVVPHQTLCGALAVGMPTDPQALFATLIVFAPFRSQSAVRVAHLPMRAARELAQIGQLPTVHAIALGPRPRVVDNQHVARAANF